MWRRRGMDNYHGPTRGGSGMESEHTTGRWSPAHPLLTRSHAPLSHSLTPTTTNPCARPRITRTLSTRPAAVTLRISQRFRCLSSAPSAFFEAGASHRTPPPTLTASFRTSRRHRRHSRTGAPSSVPAGNCGEMSLHESPLRRWLQPPWECTRVWVLCSGWMRCVPVEDYDPI